MRSAATAGRGAVADNTASKQENTLLRREIGEVLRSVRQHQGRTLREVSGQAGSRSDTSQRLSAARKKPPPNCSPPSAKLWMLRSPWSCARSPTAIALTEGVTIPDTVPDELVRQQGLTLR